MQCREPRPADGSRFLSHFAAIIPPFAVARLGDLPRIVRTAFQVLLGAAYLCAGACAAQPVRPTHNRAAIAPAQPTDTDRALPFSQHPSATVRKAARFGGGLMGAVVGLPATIVLLPVTIPLAAATKQKWVGLVPLGASYYAGGALLGGAVAPLARLDRTPAAPPATTRGERNAVATARRAVAEREAWPHGAEFAAHAFQGGWAVTAWRIAYPHNQGASRFVPGGFRTIMIDRAGKVTKYLRGH